MSKKGWKTTAQGVAFLRALATHERDAFIRNPDYMAEYLVSPALRTIARIRPIAGLVLKYCNRILPGGYYFHTARTRCIDDILIASIKQNLPQLVILGAGFDTRSYRFQNQLLNTKIFELDFPGTQAVKKSRLAAANIAVPVNITYVPIDFNNTGLEIILNHGYHRELKTLFIWEGVSMYLTSEGVDQVLSFTKHNSGPGSSIVFDYIFQSMVEGKCDYYGARESSKQAAKANEPYLFGIEEGAIREFLKLKKFDLIDEYTPDLLEQTYMKRSNGRLHGKVYHYTNIVNALCNP